MLKNYLIKLLVQFDNIPVNENIKDRAFGPEPSTNHPLPPPIYIYFNIDICSILQNEYFNGIKF